MTSSPNLSKASSTKPARKDTRKRSTTTLCVRLTVEERKRLEEMAGEQPLGAFARTRLFGKSIASRNVQTRRPTQDNIALAQVLSALGRSNLAADLQALAQAGDDGQFKLDGECHRALKRACADISAMRRDLVAALKLRPR